MLDGIETYLSRLEAENRQKRPTRDRLRTIIGAVDTRVTFDEPFIDTHPVSASPRVQVQLIRWPVFQSYEAEGLILTPKQRTLIGTVIAVPDADGVAIPPYALRLAESGCRVIIPVTVDRSDRFSGNPRVRMTNQTHREWIWRMAYQVGRHIIGYEVQQVLALVDWLSNEKPRLPIAVTGYGEGGLIALYSAAIDTRIGATLVGGYFGPRGKLADEPIYRSVWTLLRDFGDAEIASLVAPRTLIIDPADYPAVPGPPPAKDKRDTASPGKLVAFTRQAVNAELQRARRLSPKGDFHLTPDPLLVLIKKFGSNDVALPGPELTSDRPLDSAALQARAVARMTEFTQSLVRTSAAARKEQPRDKEYLWTEIIGKLPPPAEPIAPRTRLAQSRPSFTSYEVVLPVWQDVIAYGVLLVPKDIKPGERRPVVVCQHGLEDRPEDTIEPATQRAEATYHRFAARLAERGFIVFAPQNPYIGRERFRHIVRRAHPYGLSLYSFIAGQHQRATDWLKTLPFVDPERIGFYGLSYGGKTAMRIAPLVPAYKVVICSGDFNEWAWKTTSVDEPFSYMYTNELDMYEFNLANTFNYAELAGLIAPRPFMVERGHADPVGIDEWVAYEYAKVRRLYADKGIADRTSIEFFSGGHTINGVGTFEFLHKHLNWPVR
jgi:dienelactone hydrolase